MAHRVKLSVRKTTRCGSALILTALAMIPLLAMVAFAVDWGRMCLTKSELQRAADSAAMAGAWELRDATAPASRLSPSAALLAARRAAQDYSSKNTSMGNPLKLQDSDIQIGYLAILANRAVRSTRAIPNGSTPFGFGSAATRKATVLYRHSLPASWANRKPRAKLRPPPHLLEMSPVLRSQSAREAKVRTCPFCLLLWTWIHGSRP